MSDVETPRNFTSHKLLAVEALQNMKYGEEFYLDYGTEYTGFLELTIELSVHISVLTLLFSLPKSSTNYVTVLEK